MWPDEVDEIITTDQVFAFGLVTPARGVIVSPLTNFAICDRTAGTMSNGNTSIGTWKKLERIRANPKVAMAFHTREHGYGSRAEYVLVQGTASFEWPPPRDYVHHIADELQRFGGVAPSGGRLWNWWMRDFLWRVAIEVTVERIVVWPNLTCSGEPVTYGAPRPQDSPGSQPPPRNGTAPRVDHRRVVRRCMRLPNVLLGWVGADGFPVIVPVSVKRADQSTVALEAPPATVPHGTRRAGLTAHRFSRYTWGQTLRKHTGWLDVDDRGHLAYAPHTATGYSFPASKILFSLVAGADTRLGARQARKTGFLPRVR